MLVPSAYAVLWPVISTSIRPALIERHLIKTARNTITLAVNLSIAFSLIAFSLTAFTLSAFTLSAFTLSLVRSLMAPPGCKPSGSGRCWSKLKSVANSVANSVGPVGHVEIAAGRQQVVGQVEGVV